MYRFQTCIITVGGAMAVLHTGQEGQGSENDVKSGSEGLENLIAKLATFTIETLPTAQREEI